MLRIGLSLIGLAVIIFIYGKSFYVKEIERLAGEKPVRIVRKFVWLKTLQNYQYKNITVFMQARNVVQIKCVDSDKWIDVSWAAAQ